ncbi:MAG TPA: glycosyltransferase family 4 protein [Candidatus Acidoferrales bacterium]|jgi:glycosyltransferase involved in cell wall biosynthesis|nr:glycosyltransferase family 4 protein [Candidatus Acidoferrales bacterium]
MATAHKPRIVVVTPFLDPSHGTERIVCEWIEQLAGKFEIHVYSQEARGCDHSKFAWHRIPKLPGPHLLNYLWWFGANHAWRWFDKTFRSRHYDLVFSPGINCADADVISVHIVFAEYAQKNAEKLRLAGHALREWPTLIHRKLYYRLIIWLERRIYTRTDKTLVLVARKTSEQLARFYGRNDAFPVVYAGIDLEKFNVENRAPLRAQARNELGLADDAFAALLIGNDWRNKGVPAFVDALALLRDQRMHGMIVSREDSAAVRAMARERNLEERVHVLPPRADVEFYYAAADAYAGPSLEDSFSMPVAEAMACGLPVIASAAAGVSEIISNGVDGLILQNPTDAKALAVLLQRIYDDEELRSALGARAPRTAQQYTWARSGREMSVILDEALQRKQRLAAEPLAQNSDAA